MSNRIKGQEVTVSMESPDGGEDIGEVVSFEFETVFEKLLEQYLGQTAQQVDDIYLRVDGKMEVHMSTGDALRFVQKIQDRAERRTPASSVFNAICSLKFPDGPRVRVSFMDLKFGSVPFRVPGQKAYVTLALDWSCSRSRRIF